MKGKDPRKRGERTCSWSECRKKHNNLVATVNPFCSNRCKQAEKFARKRGTHARCTVCTRSYRASTLVDGVCGHCRRKEVATGEVEG